MKPEEIIEQAKAVLRHNDLGKWTRPAPGLYPHQWLWDSCFIAIGLARLKPQRAAEEIYSLLDGQWSNGMVPHMILTETKSHTTDARFWRSELSPFSPRDKQTSGITQPPLIAEACWRISRAMSKDEAHAFLRQVFPPLVAYHQWLYRERDPDQNGTVALFHPWETGIDNAPKWMAELKTVHIPLWIKTIDAFHLNKPLEKIFRKDTRFVRSEERLSTSDALRLAHVALGLRKRRYDTKLIMRRPHFVIESLSFNSILLANNQRLEQIAADIGQQIPDGLARSFERARQGFETLWDNERQQYCHRNYMTSELVPVEGIAQLLPLYSGAIPKQRASQLVATLKDESKFWLPYPVPSVPKNAPSFHPRRYWQGPTWINTNWLIIDGLRKYGHTEEADYIKQKTIELVHRNGFFEYFSPLDGQGAGTNNFSWTAALAIDLLRE